MEQGSDKLKDVDVLHGDIPRRDFLLTAALRLPFAAAVMSALGSCKGNDASKHTQLVQAPTLPVVEATPELVSNEHYIPKMDFVEGRWWAEPNFPNGLDFLEVAKRLDQAVTAYYKTILANKPGANSVNGPSFPGAPIREMFVDIDPRFEQVFKDTAFDNPIHLIEYLNLFLIRVNRFLYTEIAKREEANLYDVKSYGEIQFNDKHGGYYVELINPALKAAYDDRGFVATTMPELVQVWPNAVDVTADELVSKFGGDRASLIDAINEATKRHEAGHVYLESLFPRAKLPARIDGSFEISLPSGKNIKFAGSFEQDQYQELYGLGVELATSADTRVLADLIGVTYPQYFLASQLIVLYTAKFIPPEDYAKIFESGEPTATDLESMRRYVVQHNAVDLMHKVGQAMAKNALNAFKSAIQQ